MIILEYGRLGLLAFSLNQNKGTFKHQGQEAATAEPRCNYYGTRRDRLLIIQASTLPDDSILKPTGFVLVSACHLVRLGAKL